MNHEATSVEAILAVCRDLIAREGLSALNMRTVATGCGVALGSLYHYYPSRKELVAAAVESVWQDILAPLKECGRCDAFPETAERIFCCIQNSAHTYPHFFTGHSMDFEETAKPDARRRMAQSQLQIHQELMDSLKRDRRVAPGAFSGSFTPEVFTQLVLTMLITLLSQGFTDCGPLLEMIRRTLYLRKD